MSDEQVRINVNVGEDGRLTDALVFDLEDIEKLRRLGVCGVLSGSLPTLAQQNVFLSVPLRLMVEEAVWLVEKGYAQVTVTRPSTLVEKLSDEQLVTRVAQESQLLLEKSLARQREYKREQHLLKLQKLGIEENPRGSDQRLLESSLFLETANDSKVLNEERDEQAVQQMVLSHREDAKYCTYAALKDQGYVISPGARFGGKYIVYPGDPLRFHSHMVVSEPVDYRDDAIEFRDIINGSRLSTAVKKIWVLSGIDRQAEKQEDRVHFFSVEWAGFG